MSERRLDSVLPVEVARRSDVQKIDVKRADVVMICEVLRLDAEDQHPAIKVKPRSRNILFGSNIPELRAWVAEAITADFKWRELRTVRNQPVLLRRCDGRSGDRIVVDPPWKSPVRSSGRRTLRCR